MFPTPTIDAEAIFALSWMLDVSKEVGHYCLLQFWNITILAIF